MAFCMFALSACTGGKNGDSSKVFSADQNSAFLFEMYDYWAKKNPNTNILFSPYSVSTALAMTYVGAVGNTAEQMKNALHFSYGSKKTAEIFANLSNTMTDDYFCEKTSISIVNSLWGQKDYPFLPEYINFVRDNFSAKVKSVDFKKNTEKARQEINSWVEGKTESKIKNILAKGVLTCDSRLVLVNAIYFKSPWMAKFDKNLTEKNASFYGLDKDYKVEMMQNTARYKIAFLENSKILKIPYERDNFAMYVILPDKKNAIKDIIVDSKNLRNWISAMSFKKVRVKMPKFRIEDGYNLIPMFKKMGMTDAFTAGKADFSDIDGTRDLYISEIVHKTFCNVDEEGTEAASATAVVLDILSAPLQPEKVYEFTANRSFIFLIRHEKTKSIIFLGRFMGPGL